MSGRPKMQRKDKDHLREWGIADASDLYGIDRWGKDVFSINAAGNLCLQRGVAASEIDLKALIDEIRLRGLYPPVVLRFTDILRHRLTKICTAFAKAIREHDYAGEYRGVYPIKVNQHRHVVEDVVTCGREFHYGLEVGSKAELLIALAELSDPEALLVCNGFKDRRYVELALEASRLGLQIFLVIEKPAELNLIMEVAKRMKHSPRLGIRMKLSSRGRGPWESSGGDRSKFGLFAAEIVEALKQLKRRNMLDCLELLHFHIGSQITDIQRIKEALREATGMFSEICRLGAKIRFVDVGGGMAVDYDGSHTNFSSSANYGIEEYAADVVDAFHQTCEEDGLKPPTLVTESGRALTAHHSLLVVEATACSSPGADLTVPKLGKKDPEILKRFHGMHETLSAKNFQEIYHDVTEARREAVLLFNLRHLSLEDRAKAETYYWLICRRILKFVREHDYIPDELEGLGKLLSSTYYCNFSIFQSLPDHWAIKQLFPVAPLHRLKEKPTVEAILADVTCDSDGVMDSFVDLRDVRDTVTLHPLKRDEPYYLGIFLVGAYQEILGDLHNLFGDTTVVHVSSNEKGYLIDKAIPGDSIMDALGYVQFARREVVASLRAKVERALDSGGFTLEQSAAFMRQIDDTLDGSTYLNHAAVRW